MKGLLATAVLFLAALPAQAQYVQGGSVNAAENTIGDPWTPKTSYSFTFAKPTTAPCTILIALRQPGLTVSDSQKNSFVLASNNLGRYDQLWYSTACGSGAETVTVSCPSGTCWAQFTVSEYAGVWVADQSSDDTNATGLSSYTAPITPTQGGELIIGFGSNHATNTPQITAGTGFTLRANANEFIEDLLQVTAAPIFSSVTYPTSLTWCQSTVSFKPVATVPPPILKSVNIFGGLRYCTLCDKSAGDDTVLGINLLAGLQVQLTQVDTAGKTIGMVIFTMDAAGNISGPDNITTNATNPLLFNVAVVLPGGMTLGSLAQSIAIDPFHLQGQGSLHVLIRLDKITPNQIRGVDWFSGA